jgi:flavorubredoxin
MKFDLCPDHYARLHWIDEFVRNVAPFIHIREADNLLIKIPNEAYKLNPQGVRVLKHLLAGEGIYSIVDSYTEKEKVAYDPHVFFCDLRSLLKGCYNDAEQRLAIDRIPFSLPFNTLPVLSKIAITYRCNLSCRFCYAGCGCKKKEEKKEEKKKGKGEASELDMLANFYNVTQNLLMVKDGDTLALGEKTLKFYLTPMLHWPETMMSYLVEEKLLFSGDAFGGFCALDGGIFDDEVSTCYVDNEIMRYFTNIVGKYGAMVQAALKKLAALEVKTICSTHGPIWRSKPEHIIAKHDQWSKQEADRCVVIVYCSMYGNTEQLADRVARKLVAAGEENVQVINAATTHVSYIINEIWKYNALVLAAPTYNLFIFPTMKFILEYMEDYGVKDKISGLLSSYTWSGGAIKKMKDAVQKLKWELTEPVIEVKSAAKEADFLECDRLALAIHDELEKFSVNKPGCEC